MKRMKKVQTDFLFSTPSFLIGLGSVLNISGNYFEFNESSSDQEADKRALSCDFKMIGQDLKDSLNSAGK